MDYQKEVVRVRAELWKDVYIASFPERKQYPPGYAQECANNAVLKFDDAFRQYLPKDAAS